MWEGNFRILSSSIDALIERNASLETILDEEDIIDEFTIENKKLLEYLGKPDIIEQLFHFLTHEITVYDEKKRFRLPYLAGEIISSPKQAIHEALKSEKVLDTVIEWLKDPRLPQAVYATNMKKPIINVILSNNDAFFKRWKEEAICDCMLKKVSVFPIAELLIDIFEIIYTLFGPKDLENILIETDFVSSCVIAMKAPKQSISNCFNIIHILNNVLGLFIPDPILDGVFGSDPEEEMNNQSEEDEIGSSSVNQLSSCPLSPSSVVEVLKKSSHFNDLIDLCFPQPISFVAAPNSLRPSLSLFLFLLTLQVPNHPTQQAISVEEITNNESSASCNAITSFVSETVVPRLPLLIPWLLFTQTTSDEKSDVHSSSFSSSSTSPTSSTTSVLPQNVNDNQKNNILSLRTKIDELIATLVVVAPSERLLSTFLIPYSEAYRTSHGDQMTQSTPPTSTEDEYGFHTLLDSFLYLFNNYPSCSILLSSISQIFQHILSLPINQESSESNILTQKLLEALLWGKEEEKENDKSKESITNSKGLVEIMIEGFENEKIERARRMKEREEKKLKQNEINKRKLERIQRISEASEQDIEHILREYDERQEKRDEEQKRIEAEEKEKGIVRSVLSTPFIAHSIRFCSILFDPDFPLSSSSCASSDKRKSLLSHLQILYQERGANVIEKQNRPAKVPVGEQKSLYAPLIASLKKSNNAQDRQLVQALMSFAQESEQLGMEDGMKEGENAGEADDGSELRLIKEMEERIQSEEDREREDWARSEKLGLPTGDALKQGVDGKFRNGKAEKEEIQEECTKEGNSTDEEASDSSDLSKTVRMNGSQWLLMKNFNRNIRSEDVSSSNVPEVPAPPTLESIMAEPDEEDFEETITLEEIMNEKDEIDELLN
ncbi:uncharacterized protein MONOS_12486 [Monocercomonoides exilis]|uniref:uncharacterized protein n=1 Tax=Monocercomonoides exilis TaxID=2049356 RepID=UPI00355956E4|nr:hypothetical protein MONOS_12486 [Monocercomonoides exilis]|eukprot:MONOS_12486.1-p1 / transcript=MONOS_12486.1 / gene=MONOS_12486 / organism=Monocercomonoides_exilis_PA203 / gene_product=unspecified product / transcript_product=unspecified product / location=Mono_scaffold00694:22817-25692(+) / protein_length=892 / sequence_SO=supercontig / SO=protein_coding / is_pseudo=false